MNGMLGILRILLPMFHMFAVAFQVSHLCCAALKASVWVSLWSAGMRESWVLKVQVSPGFLAGNPPPFPHTCGRAHTRSAGILPGESENSQGGLLGQHVYT